MIRRFWIAIRLPILVSVGFLAIYFGTGLFKKIVFPILPEGLESIAGWGALFLSAGLVAYIMGRPLRREVEVLRRAASQMGAGHLDTRAEVVEGSFTEPVTTAFNDMANRLETLVETREHLLQTMAHEIRTPLARIRFILDNLESAPNLTAVRAEVQDLDTQITELETLVDEVLNGLRDTHATNGRSPHSVNPMLHQVVDQIDSAQIRVQLKIPDTNLPPIWVSPAGFRRVISNLLSNAIEHAVSQVNLIVSEDNGVVVVAVEDDGPGIPVSDRARAVEPFERLGDPAQRTRNGLGLGLAIANRISLAHGESIQILEGTLGGASFVTRWPTDSP